jgi:hypothetical protein
MDDVVAVIAAVGAVAQQEAPLVEHPVVVDGAHHRRAARCVQRAAATGHRDDVDLVTGDGLGLGEIVHVHLDATEPGKVGVGDVENPHPHRPALMWPALSWAALVRPACERIEMT